MPATIGTQESKRTLGITVSDAQPLSWWGAQGAAGTDGEAYLVDRKRNVDSMLSQFRKQLEVLPEMTESASIPSMPRHPAHDRTHDAGAPPSRKRGE